MPALSKHGERAYVAVEEGWPGERCGCLIKVVDGYKPTEMTLWLIMVLNSERRD